jgi:hypothetical protein
VGNLQILSGIAPAAKVEEELKHLVDAKWEWKVKQVDRDNYIAVFPNKMIFDTFSRSGSIELAIHKISAKVSKSDSNLEVTRRLQIGWVKLFGIPSMARSEEVVRLVAKLAGEVVCVDEVSLIKEGHVRVKINAREISKIRGYVDVFIEIVGYEIRFLPKKSSGKSTAPKDIPPRKLDGDSEEEDEDGNKDSELERERMRKEFKKEEHKDQLGNQKTHSKSTGKQVVNSSEGKEAEDK